MAKTASLHQLGFGMRNGATSAKRMNRTINITVIVFLGIQRSLLRLILFKAICLSVKTRDAKATGHVFIHRMHQRTRTGY
jgi:hypothetical protein